MMRPNTQPMAINKEEWTELTSLKDVQEAWGYEPGDDLGELQSRIYAVRFDFVSGNPGYCGPMYLLHGDGAPETPPMTIIRGENGELISVQD